MNGKFEASFIFGEEKLFDLIIKNGILLSKTVSERKQAKHYFFPSFVDTHNHFMAYAILQISVDLYKAQSKGQIKEKILNYIQKERPIFVLAEGWDENFFKEKSLLSKEDLDCISKDIPIFARRIDGHMTITNQAGLEYLQSKRIKIDSPIILEELSLNISNYLDFTKEQIRKGYDKAVKKAYSLGVVGVSDFLTKKYYQYYKNVDIPSNFFVNYYFFNSYIDENPLVKENFTYMGIKLFADGSIGANTAMVSFPYLNGKGNGMLLLEKEYIQDIVKRYVEDDKQVSIHAIGDIAVKYVLDSIDELKINNGNIRLEHLEFINDEDLIKIKRNKLNVSMQPNFIGMWGMPNQMYEEKFGKKYLENNKIKSISKYANIFAFGSDNMPFSPSYGIYYALNHPNENEQISFENAIIYYSFNGFKLFNKKYEFMKVNKPITALYYNQKPDINRGENFLNPQKTIIKGSIVYEKN